MPDCTIALNCCPGDNSLDYEIVPVTELYVQTSVIPAGISDSSGDGFYPPGELVTVVATAQIGYEFVGWFNGGGGKVGSAFVYSFHIYNNQNLQARFVPE